MTTETCKVCKRKFENRRGLMAHLKSHGLTTAYYQYHYENLLRECGTCRKPLSYRFVEKNRRYGSGSTIYCSEACGTHAKSKTVEFFMLHYKVPLDAALKKYESYHKKAGKNRVVPTQVAYWKNLGYTSSESAAKVAEFQAHASKPRFIARYGEKEGGIAYEEFCKQRSIKYSGVGNPRFGAVVTERTRTKISKQVKLTLASTEGKLAYFKRFLNPKFNGLRQSNGEEVLAKLFKKYGVDVTTQFPLLVTEDHVWTHKLTNKVAYVFDFKILGRKILIEFNGDYIHANPSMFPPNAKINYYGGHFTAKDRWKKDELKTEYARSLGYKVFTIWESEDSAVFVKKVLKYLQKPRSTSRKVSHEVRCH